MSSDGYQCPRCQQQVIKHEGTGKIMNLGNGPGGYRGKEHDHRNPAINWKKHEHDTQKKHCPICGIEYYRSVFTLCPNCMAYQCRNCEKLRTPKVILEACECGEKTFDVTTTTTKTS